MASNRHLGRIIALQSLYELEFRTEAADPQVDIEAIVERNIGRFKKLLDDKDFVRHLVHGTASHITELDAALQPLASEWPIDQIARLDRAVLRLGLYELQHAEGVPPRVVINEAVELAKAFGGDKSAGFINGVLGTYYRQNIDPTSAKPGQASALPGDDPAGSTDTADDKADEKQAAPVIGTEATA